MCAEGATFAHIHLWCMIMDWYTTLSLNTELLSIFSRTGSADGQAFAVIWLYASLRVKRWIWWLSCVDLPLELHLALLSSLLHHWHLSDISFHLLSIRQGIMLSLITLGWNIAIVRALANHVWAFWACILRALCLPDINMCMTLDIICRFLVPWMKDRLLLLSIIYICWCLSNVTLLVTYLFTRIRQSSPRWPCLNGQYLMSTHHLLPFYCLGTEQS